MKTKLHHVPALATITLVAGCFHAAVEPAPPHASSAERIAAYERLRLRAGVERDREGAVIGDGTTVASSSDLLPVLDPATPAARAARRSAAARHHRATWAIGGMVVASTGLALAAVDLVSTSSVDGHGSGPLRDDSSRIGAVVGLTTFAVGLLAGSIGQMHYGEIERREEHAAFVSYDASLRRSLRVCTDGLQVTDCDAHAAPSVALTAR